MAHDLMEPFDRWFDHLIWQRYFPLRYGIILILNVAYDVVDIVVQTFINIIIGVALL